MTRSPLRALGWLLSPAIALLPSVGQAQVFNPDAHLPTPANSCHPSQTGVDFDGMCLTADMAPAVFGLDEPGVTDSYFGFCWNDAGLVHNCAEVAADLPGMGFQRQRLTDVPCADSSCAFGYEPVVVALAGSGISLEFVRWDGLKQYKEIEPKPIKEIKLKLPYFKPGHGPNPDPKPKPEPEPLPEPEPDEDEDELVEFQYLSALRYDPSVYPGRPDDLVYTSTWTEPIDPYLGVTDLDEACAVAASRVRGLLEVALQELTLECQAFAPFSSSGQVQLPEFLVNFEHEGQLHELDACAATDGHLRHELLLGEAHQLQMCLQDPSAYLDLQ